MSATISVGARRARRAGCRSATQTCQHTSAQDGPSNRKKVCDGLVRVGQAQASLVGRVCRIFTVDAGRGANIVLAGRDDNIVLRHRALRGNRQRCDEKYFRDGHDSLQMNFLRYGTIRHQVEAVSLTIGGE